jgi:hypothetical protein
LLHRWQQQCDENANDGDNNQQFNERKAGHTPARSGKGHR